MAQRKTDLLTISEAKRWLRQLMVQLRQQITPNARLQKSHKIAAHLSKTTAFKNAKTVAGFITYGSEVDTEAILDACWRGRKTVVLPVVESAGQKAFFVSFRQGQPLKKGVLGPLEPAEQRAPFDWSSIDLVLVPGLAFDSNGYRLGYGGGIYDRLLLKTRRAAAIGVFFDEQRLRLLPVESHDVPMAGVVTESGVYLTQNSEKR